jgi:predicted dehydrogenase
MTPQQPVRAALVGVGAWGRVLASAAAISDKIDFICCVGRDPERLQVFSRETGLPARAGLESVLADPALDALVLAVPNELHYPFAELAARWGKHVYIEKPIASTLVDGLKVTQLERAYGIRVVVGHCARFLAGNRLIREAIDAGALGKVSQIEANFSNGRALRLTPQDWRWYANRAPGGSLSQIAIHQFDTLRFLGGDIVSVNAVAARHSPVGAEVEDQWIVTVTFADEKLGVVISNWTTPGAHSVRVAGDKAVMFYEVDETKWASPALLHRDATLHLQSQGEGAGARQRIPLPEGNMFRDELELFANCIRGDTGCELSADNGCRALAAVYAALASAADGGRTVEIEEIMAQARSRTDPAHAQAAAEHRTLGTRKTAAKDLHGV